MRQELREGGYDVVHVHEPIVPVVGWDAVGLSGLPVVGTFHTYSTNRLTNNLGNLAGARRRFNHLHVRIAVSRAAAWTGERFFGGHYRVIPNGVTVPDRISRAPAGIPTPERPLRLAFVGQAVARKGLPVALRAFEALREHVPVTFDLIGVERAQARADAFGPAAGSPPSGRSATSRRPRSSRRPICSSPRRSGARASAWC